MNRRPSSVLLTVLCLTLTWFFTRQVYDRHWLSVFGILASFKIVDIEPPLSPVYLSYFQPRVKVLSKTQTLFYEFKIESGHGEDLEGLVSINKSDHEKETLSLAKINCPQDSAVKEQGDKLFSFNLLVSNRIGQFRLIPDTRPATCPKTKQQQLLVSEGRDHPADNQDQKLQASIVICYYNEAPSALLRTIHSILKRSNLEMVKEILIIDDFSEPEYDVEQIKPHIGSDIVRCMRTSKREGLIRARLFGAGLALGNVLIFLDSHVEANQGWLEPLMDTIRKNRTTVACPMIDLINAETLIYSASPMVKGGLTWALHFKWDSVPSEDLKSYEDFAKPIESPTMAGGLYAIRKDYFYALGGYDSGMNLWGGENIEMSLRTWMCGGQISILPCSRLGHIFRKTRPYGPDPDQPDSLLYNSHRSARVWLDDYIHKFYEASPEAKDLDSGDVTDRVLLRQKLNCNNFTWFLDNVYPKLKIDLADKDRTVQESTKKSIVLSKKVNDEL